MRKATEWSFILLVSAALTAFLLHEFAFTTGDTLRDCTLTLGSSGNRFSPGEEICLTLAVTPTQTKTVTFSDPISDSVILRPLTKQLAAQDLPPLRKVRVTMSPRAPLALTIRGHVKQGSSPGSLIVDFGEYGVATVETNGVLSVSAKIRPALTATADSGEWRPSNAVRLILTERGHDSPEYH